MGVSTDGILFYGICIEAEGELHERINEESRSGEDGEPAEGTLAWLHFMGDPDLGCVVDTHCSGEYPMYYVAAEGSVTKARRGHTEEITSLDIGPEWRANLAAFCEKYGIPPEEPKWWLVSYWG